MNWQSVSDLIASTGARNVRVVGDRLIGNDGLVLSFDPKIAAGYVRTDWDAVACQPAHKGA